MFEKQFKQVCECTNCGNEAEMTITCQLKEAQAEEKQPSVVQSGEGNVKGHAVCSQCGNEADIWLDA